MNEGKEDIMEIGDVVIPRRISGISESLILHSGNNLYPCAIVANMKPFILVSVGGDMLWEDVDYEDLIVLCPSHSIVTDRAVARWKNHDYQKSLNILKEKHKQVIDLANWSDSSSCFGASAAKLFDVAKDLEGYIKNFYKGKISE
jgi:hypothetical protein